MTYCVGFASVGLHCSFRSLPLGGPPPLAALLLAQPILEYYTVAAVVCILRIYGPV